MNLLQSRSALGALVTLLSLATFAACGGESERGARTERPTGNAGEPTANAGASAKPHPSSAGTSATGALGGSPTVTDNAGGAIGAQGSEAGANSGEAGSPAAGAPNDPTVTSCDPIQFEDSVLEASVRALLQKPSGALTSADVVGFTDLTTDSVGSLKGVECLTDLTTLDIGSLPPGTVTDLGPLATLNKLETLSISRLPVASLEPLAKLRELQNLYMFKMPVELDLAPLGHLSRLVYLDLNGDTIDSLAPLNGATALRTLNVRAGTVLQPDNPLALQSLEDFDATSVFSDAAPLAGLTNLTRLRIGGKPLSDFSSLAGLTKLRYLDITSAGVSDLTPVAGMQQLSGLAAYGNQITDVTPLQSLAKLSVLILIDNRVTDVTPLVSNPGLASGDSIYLNQNPLACAAQAANLQALQGRGVHVNSDCP